MASLAELLDYDQRKKQALQALTDYASSQYKLGSAFGEGLSDQAKGLVQMVRHPIDTATQMYQAGKAVVQNPRAAYQAAKEGLTEAVSSPQNIARFAGQNFNPLELANALNKVGTMRELTVYHGTPHKFEPTPDNPLGEFTASKIGTGEGKQVYGYGTYVAESPKVGSQFQETLKHKNYAKLVQNDPATNSYQVVAKDGTVLADNVYFHQAHKIKKEYDDAQKGSLYTADLPDEMIDKMLHFDKPLSEQSEFVKSALLKTEHPEIIKMLNESPVNKGDHWEFLGNTYNSKKEALSDATGAEIMLGRTGFGKSPKDISEKLSALGISGVQYMQPHGSQELRNTRNFVVFPGEEKNLKILSRE